MSNKAYTSKFLLDKYMNERNRWEEFYPSERHIMSKVFGQYAAPFSLLDVGCGCGGLATALQDHFTLQHYTGVDISEGEIDYAKNRSDIRIPHSFRREDICRWKSEEQFDVVMSLGCIDWNEEVMQMLNACYDMVARGGYLITSFRLTNHETMLSGAYQYLDVTEKKGETANYAVFNLNDLLKTLDRLDKKPDRIEAYGYWGVPSKTAVVPYDRLCFSVFAIHKPLENDYDHESYVELELPTSLFL